VNTVDIGYGELSLSLGFVLAAGISSVFLQLGLQREIFWGTVRTVSQLFLMGYVLRYIFQFNSPWPVLFLYSGMILFAAYIIFGRVKEREVPFLMPTAVSMVVSYLLATMIVTAVIVRVRPWYQPAYFLPLGGMVVGNSMNAVAVTLERLFKDLKLQRPVVEMYLSLGADYREASQEIFRDAVRAGMIPSINSMMGVGVVFIPGMMTGQILAGADPLVAVKYQIMIMLVLTGATALGSTLVAWWVRKRCFSPDHRLLLGRGEVQGKKGS
jgi:putative ABC transport system permease protein